MDLIKWTIWDHIIWNHGYVTYHMGPFHRELYHMGTFHMVPLSYRTILYGILYNVPFGSYRMIHTYVYVKYGPYNMIHMYNMVHIIWTSLDHMVPTICYGKCLSFIFMDPNFEFFFLNFLWSILNQHNCQPNNFFAYFYISFTW